MNRVPMKGDIISIGRNELLVLDSRRDTSGAGEMERTNGFIFDVMKRDDLGKANPKTKTYYIPHYSNDFWSNQIKLTEIVFHEQIKLKTTITYTEK